MAYRGTSFGGGGLFGFPPILTKLVLINIAVFLVQNLSSNMLIIPGWLALVPREVVRGQVWELVTYMFMHGSFMHLLFNMFYLLMFGSDLERWWGSRDFLKYYLITGVGAGLIQVITSYMFPGSGPDPNAMIPTIGASGAIFGVLLAYGMAFPNRQILLWFVIPVSARVLVLFAALMELVFVSSGNMDGVARFAHLGGMLVGYLYLKQDTVLWRGKRLWRQFQAGQQASRTRDRDPGPEDAERQARIDAILEKISRDGMGALTEEEKRMLRESADRARRRQGRD